MRLQKVESGHRPKQKLLLLFIQLISLRQPLDVVKLFMYRPEYFGKDFCSLGQQLLRGPSSWSVGERELFGAFTSKLNKCVF
jgi:hypothetical protein